jgi:hypothetical protein
MQYNNAMLATALEKCIQVKQDKGENVPLQYVLLLGRIGGTLDLAAPSNKKLCRKLQRWLMVG